MSGSKRLDSDKSKFTEEATKKNNYELPENYIKEDN